MTAKTPTARSLEHLRKEGWTVDVVERWLPVFGGNSVRKDFLGLFDLVAVREAETMAVQVTSGSNVSSRVHKIADGEHLPALRKAGWTLVVHGWRKNAAGRWTLRVVDVS